MPGSFFPTRRGAALFFLAALLFSCDGIYDDISQMPSDTVTDNSFSYVNATDYTTWVYIDLSGGEVTTLAYDDTENVPADWTFALHRYDCKTNCGSVFETDFTSIAELEDALAGGWFALPAEEEFTPDTEGEIAIDVSHMIEGYLTYAEVRMNKVLTSWLDVNLITMPPIYTQSGKVYLLRLSDGVLAAIRFTGFTNPYYYDAKGYISFDYVYPLEVAQ